MKIQKFNMNEDGLNRFFGPLEARIMDTVWSSGETSIKEVQAVLNEESEISFNAVMTVMNRLLEKGHLSKKTKGRGSVYIAVQTKDRFIMEQTRAVTQGLIHDFGDLVVNHLVDSLQDADPELIIKLENKLKELKKGKIDET
jgi:predicted transcriptional regulator